MTSATYEAACGYLAAGFSLIPCTVNKRPAIAHWKYWTDYRPTMDDLEYWFKPYGHSIGLIMGRVSGNVVAVDLDGEEPVTMFLAQFPDLAETLRVRTGSGIGAHFYFRVARMIPNVNVRVDKVGGFEIRGNGQYVIAPPSLHPSGGQYQVERNVPIMVVPDLEAVALWMHSLKLETPKKPPAVSMYNQSTFSPKRKRNHDGYIRAAFNGEVSKVAAAAAGNRNNTLFYAALRLANYSALERVRTGVDDRCNVNRYAATGSGPDH